MYDVPVKFTPKFEKVDSVSFSVKGHTMIDPERVEGLTFDRVLWTGLTQVLADAAGNEMNALNDDHLYFWEEEDDEDIVRSEWTRWMKADSTVVLPDGNDNFGDVTWEEEGALDDQAAERRLLDGSRTQVSTLWLYAWMSFEGFMNFMDQNHPRLVASAESYENRADELGQVVRARDSEALDPLLHRVRDTAAHTYFGEYGKAVLNLTTLWYLMSHVYRSDLSGMEFGLARKRRYGPRGGRLQGDANSHSFQENEQERRGCIVDGFYGGLSELEEQVRKIFPCSHDEFRDWCQRGFDGYGGTNVVEPYGQSEHLSDSLYGQQLRMKASAVRPGMADAESGQIVRWAEDSKEMVDKTRPHFLVYAIGTLRVLQLLYAESNQPFLQGNDLVVKLKLMLVENLFQLKRMVRRYSTKNEIQCIYLLFYCPVWEL